MEIIEQDYFDRLPNEIIQFVFSRISDCKTLVRCMSVSKAFRAQSTLVCSLSIVCPGNFSSYDEKLRKVYTMVKEFRKLQTLVVRVGQPKEEAPSWTRCMRYAEMGMSVDKFVFMAAKTGDFSEFDCTLTGLDATKNVRTRTLSSDAPLPLDMNCDAEADYNRISMTGQVYSGRTADRAEIGNQFHSGEREKGATEEGRPQTYEERESDKERCQQASFPKDRTGLRQTGQSKLGRTEESCQKNSGRSWSSHNDGRRVGPNSFFARRLHERRQLSDFTLRQVIAPRDEVLNRMLPVIHFAILQGLNDLRDSLPAFIARFPKLRRFLLVDMIESVTYHMREHHIQEIRSLHHQGKIDCVDQKPDFTKLEERDGRLDRSEGGNPQVGVGNRFITEEVGNGTATGQEILGHGLCADKLIREARQKLCSDPTEIGIGERRGEDMLALGNRKESNGPCWKNVKCDVKKGWEKGKELMICDAEDAFLSRSSSCSLSDGAESSSYSSRIRSQFRGLGHLSPHDAYFNEDEIGVNRNSCMKSIIYNCNLPLTSDCHGAESEESPCSGDASHDHDHIELERNDIVGSCDVPSSGDSEGGGSDSEEFGVDHWKNTAFRKLQTGRPCRVPCLPEDSGCLTASQKDVECGRVADRQSKNGQNRHEITKENIHSQKIESLEANPEAESDELLQLRYVEGWDGRLDGFQVVGKSYKRVDTLQWKSCMPVGSVRTALKERKMDATSRNPFKRGQKSENCGMRESNRNLKFGCFRRRDDYQSRFESSRRKGECRGCIIDCLTRSGEGIHSRTARRVEKSECTLFPRADKKKVDCFIDTGEFATCKQLSMRERTAGKDYGPYWRIENSRNTESAFVFDRCLERNSDNVALLTSSSNDTKQNVEAEKVPAKNLELAWTTADCAHDEAGLPGCNINGKHSANNGVHDNDSNLRAYGLESNERDCGPCSECMQFKGSTDCIELQEAWGGNNSDGNEIHHLVDRPTGGRLSLRINFPQLDKEQASLEVARGGNGSMHTGLLTGSMGEQPVEVDVLRHTRRETVREQVRRLRDKQWEAQGQRHSENDSEGQRQRARDLLRKRHSDLEEEALSFDYTFWRAEQVAANGYHMSDVSMCIATQSARPLGDKDIEVLACAALAGPLLVATVYHVNKQHGSHNL